MEKDDEVYGTGNSMTAKFWQYDARLGRRWNIDPVVKPWMSLYSTFSNNPIARIDTKGDDDYFDMKGNYLYSTKTGTKIRIVAFNNICILPSEMPFPVRKDKKYNYYVASELANDAVSKIISRYHKSDAEFVLAIDEDSYAFVRDGVKKNRINISLSVDENTTDALLDDYNNLKSLLYHEEQHRKEERTLSDHFMEGARRHINVYFKQFEHESFENTT